MKKRYIYAEEAVELLKRKGASVALAESCTGGMVAETITSVSGASEIFETGIVSYSEGVKTELLSVPAELIAGKSVVSREVAEAMAEGVRRLARSDYGIGITGVAGPGPNGGHPEGEIYVALSDSCGTVTEKLMTGTFGEREGNREKASETAFLMLINRIK